MISSIKFTCNKLINEDNYITEKRFKHVLKDDINKSELEKKYKQTSLGRILSRYDRDKYMNYFEDGDKNPQLISNLLNRKIEFSKDKINILFGPNGSGKTTILKTLAAHGLCGHNNSQDGFTNMLKYDPLNYCDNLFCDKEVKTDKDVELIKLIHSTARNVAEVEWDGNPIYYDDFCNRKLYTIGDLQGSLLNSTVEEVSYLFNKNKISTGQNSMYLLNKLIKICDTNINYDEEYKNLIKDKSYGNWQLAIQTGYKYIMSKYQKQTCKTILLDEIDKSLDINNVIYLYLDILPYIVNKYNVQIILVSHSPIIMSNNILNNDKYNIISLDEKYTENVKNNLKTILF